MNLTVDQVLALAPDAAAAAAGKKLAAPSVWRNLGRDGNALWGECQGSALYQVRVDLSDLATKCSCPSRKIPCKHSLGLLLVLAMTAALVPTESPPEWVTEWMARRVVAAERKVARAASPAAPVDADAQMRRADQRHERVAKGIEALDLWLADIVRNGIAALQGQPPKTWETQAARLVDAQAPGLASRVRRIGELVGEGAEWPSRVLNELGRLALVTEAYRRIEALPALLQRDVKQLIGWTMTQEEVVAEGESLADEWVVVGQHVEPDERMRVQRSWLLGARSGRRALILQFAASAMPFAENLVPGTAFAGELAFWPSSSPERALIRARRGPPSPCGERLPGFDSVRALLDDVAARVASLPWTDRVGVVLRGAVPVATQGANAVVLDAHGDGLPLGPRDTWRILALSGGGPVDLAGEWDGRALKPLGLLVRGTYYPLGREAS